MARPGLEAYRCPGHPGQVRLHAAGTAFWLAFFDAFFSEGNGFGAKAWPKTWGMIESSRVRSRHGIYAMVKSEPVAHMKPARRHGL